MRQRGCRTSRISAPTNRNHPLPRRRPRLPSHRRALHLPMDALPTFTAAAAPRDGSLFPSSPPRPRRVAGRAPLRLLSRRPPCSPMPEGAAEMHLSENKGIEEVWFATTSGQGFAGATICLELILRDALEVCSLDLRNSFSWSRRRQLLQGNDSK